MHPVAVEHQLAGFTDLVWKLGKIRITLYKSNKRPNNKLRPTSINQLANDYVLIATSKLTIGANFTETPAKLNKLIHAS